MGGYIPRQKGDPTRSAVVVKCEGEAHSNAYIDNCMVCAPDWGKYHVCPECTIKLAKTKRYAVGVCPNEDCTSYRKKFILP